MYFFVFTLVLYEAIANVGFDVYENRGTTLESIIWSRVSSDTF